MIFFILFVISLVILLVTRSREFKEREIDMSANKSPGLDMMDAVGVSVIRHQNKTMVDSIELRSLNDSSQPAPVTPSSSVSMPAMFANGNNSGSHKSSGGATSVDKKAGGEGERRSRPNSFNGSLVNPDSYSTDL